ncbi:MAG: HD domain-containing protein, partial [Burkholderiales bacterium]
IIYSILLFSTFLITILRQKQEKKRLEAKLAYWLEESEAARNQIADVLRYRNELARELNDEQIALFDSTAAAYMQQAIYRVTDYLRLKVSKFNINELLAQVKTTLQLYDLDSQPQFIIENHIQVKTIQADLNKVKQLLVDSILCIQQNNLSHKPITIVLDEVKLGHTIDHIQNYVRELAALKFTITIDYQTPPNKSIYMVSPTQAASQNPQAPGEPMILDNLRIVDAHYGFSDIQATTHVYVIPVNVREVRGKVMELLREPAAVDPDELKHPLAIELEQEILDRLRGEKVAIKVIKKALNTIKRYHGGVKRKSGEPFFTHPMQVALILMDYTKDQDAILGALLHDTVEDTALSLVHIKAMFGGTVAFLVNKITNLEDKIKRINLEEYEYNYRLMNYEDERVALIKLADRLHN